MTKSDAPILVTGATGTQGGAVARALLRDGQKVRALVRNPDAAAAVALRDAGCELATGDFDDAASLADALEGVRAVFSVQRPDLDGTDSERRHGKALVSAARAAGVSHFIHSSVCQLDDHTHFPRWDEGYWSVSYWTGKHDVEQMVKDAGFAQTTFVRPSFIMENFANTKARFLYPQLGEGLLQTPIEPDAKLQLIAADDIGAFVAAAVADPERYNREVIELAGDEMTVGEVAGVLEQELGTPVAARSVSPKEAQESGQAAGWVRSQEWINVVGYQVDRTRLTHYPVSMTPFPQWVRAHRDEIRGGQ